MTGGNQSGKSISASAEIAYFMLGSHPYQLLERRPYEVYALSAEYRTILKGLWRHLRPDGVRYKGAGFLPIDRIHKLGSKIPGWDIPSFVEVISDIKDNEGKPFINRLEFISAEGGESARRRVQSAAIDILAVDEEIDGSLWEEILVRTLATNGRVIFSATLVRSEPWALELEERADSGDPDVSLSRLDTSLNKHLDEKQVNRVFKNMTAEERAVRMSGLSRREHGLVYVTHVGHWIDPFPIPEHWTRFNIIDPGFRTTACLWLAMNPADYTMVAYRELYRKNAMLWETVEEINTEEGYQLADGARLMIGPGSEMINHRIIDPAAFQHMQNGSVGIAAQLATLYDMPCQPGMNNVQFGIEMVRNLLKGHLRFFNTLVNLKRESKTYKIKRDKVTMGSDATKETPIKRDDHLMDCLRYGCVAAANYIPIKLSKVEEKEDLIKKHVDSLSKKKNNNPYLGSYG